MEIDLGTFSDLYKDAYGFRPAASICPTTEADYQMELEKDLQAANLIKWNAHIASIMELVSCDRSKALQIDIDAMGVDGDIGYYLYEWNIPYSLAIEIEDGLK
jgi:hypothetical protein